MLKLKKTLAVFLSAVLAFSLMSVSAFASDPKSDVPTGSQLEVSDEAMSLDEAAEDELADEVAEPEADAAEVAASEAEPADKAPEQAEEPEATAVDAAEAIEFVYIESSVLSVGETQYVVVGFNEDPGASSARATFAKSNSAEALKVDASAMEDGAMLFTKEFSNSADIAGYLLSSITYHVGEDAFRIDFGEADMTSVAVDEDKAEIEQIGDVDVLSTEVPGEEKAAYAFDVVSADLADTLEEGTDDTTVIAITDEGDMVATDTVEEAIDLVDAEGVAEGEIGDAVAEDVAPDVAFTDGTEGAELPKAGTPVNAANPDGSDAFVPSTEDGFAVETYDADAALPMEESEAEEAKEQSWFDSIISFFVGLFTPDEAWGAASNAREDYLVVAIDPGHGGSDGGANGYGIVEKNVNLKIARYFRDELSTYTGVTPYMTRTGDTYVGLQERVNKAVSVGAHVFVSVHNNSGGGSGSEVWVPNTSSYLKSTTQAIGKSLGDKIVAKVAAVSGGKNRGVKTRNSESGTRYSDGSIADYYSVIYNSRKAGIPGIIVEHAFLDNSSDAAKLKDEGYLKKFGVADAAGVAQQYGLIRDAVARSSSLVAVKAHMQNLGWEKEVYDKKVAGLTGKSRRMEAFTVALTNAAKNAGGNIEYRSNNGSGWAGWAKNGATAGSTGTGKGLQAIQIQLTGDVANKYDVYYRTHVANIGWLGWAKNGASSGSSGYGYNIEAVEVALVDKGKDAPGSTSNVFAQPAPTYVNYSTHVQNIGWQASAKDGGQAGTTGRGLRLEGIKISLGSAASGSIEYSTHIQNIGWQGWKSNGAISGTTGRGLRLEAIKIQLKGDAANKYDVYYRVHAQNFGWLGWAKNGGTAGTSAYGYRLEAIQVKLVSKGANNAPGSTANPYRTKYVQYSTHVQNIGWQGAANDGATAGTTGRGLRLEGIKLSLGPDVSGGIQYRTHIQNIGWEKTRKTNNAMSGTSGRGLRLEAIQIQLAGDAKSKYDIYYRVHAQNIGWMGWAKNGESAGTAGYGYRLEGIQVKLMAKGATPGSTAEPFRDKTSSAIMGSSQASVKNMVNYFYAQKKQYPADVYTSKGAKDITAFAQIVLEEAKAEGVRAEVVFCQAMKETGWLQFGGDVKATQCNFAGLGATGGGVGGASFPDVRTGIRAQVQHLKAYASTAALKNKCVDPRFGRVTRGSATSLQDLNGKWAVPGNGYGQDIVAMIKTCLSK